MLKTGERTSKDGLQRVLTQLVEEGLRPRVRGPDSWILRGTTRRTHVSNAHHPSRPPVHYTGCLRQCPSYVLPWGAELGETPPRRTVKVNTQVDRGGGIFLCFKEVIIDGRCKFGQN